MDTLKIINLIIIGIITLLSLIFGYFNIVGGGFNFLTPFLIILISLNCIFFVFSILVFKKNEIHKLVNRSMIINIVIVGLILVLLLFVFTHDIWFGSCVECSSADIFMWITFILGGGIVIAYLTSFIFFLKGFFKSS